MNNFGKFVYSLRKLAIQAGKADGNKVWHRDHCWDVRIDYFLRRGKEKIRIHFKFSGTCRGRIGVYLFCK